MTNVCMTLHKDTASSNLCLQRSVPGKFPALNSAGEEWDKGPMAESNRALYREWSGPSSPTWCKTHMIGKVVGWVHEPREGPL